MWKVLQPDWLWLQEFNQLNTMTARIPALVVAWQILVKNISCCVILMALKRLLLTSVCVIVYHLLIVF